MFLCSEWHVFVFLTNMGHVIQVWRWIHENVCNVHAHGLYSFMLKLVVHLQEPGHFVIVGLILSV
jgi:hypothetical protein